MSTDNPLPWDKYLVRVNGQLAVADTPPVCECCNGNGICPICDSTGLGWHWHITPTAGMLCEVTSADINGDSCNEQVDAVGDWIVHPGGWLAGHDARTVIAPLLPPADMLPVPELLGLIGATGPCCMLNHYADQRAVATSFFDYETGEPTIQIHANCYTDTAPLKQAIQHHEALQEWLAAAKEAV
ncbi:MAG: hypothetical protein WC381_10725 [Kiritimatiellia bacterium]|jgi:hypothetical protein